MSMRPSYRFLRIALAAGWVLGWSASGAQADRIVVGASAKEADVVVGCIYPMTGRAATYGEDSVMGIRLALQDLKAEAATGLPTPHIRVIVDDALSKVSYGLRLAEDFIDQDGVNFLCGMVSSGVAHAISDLARRRRVILVGTDHASSRLTIEAGHRYYFRFSNDSWISNAAGARYLRDIRAEQPWRRIAFLNPDYDYGHVSRDDLLAAMDQLGMDYEVVAELWPKLYYPDYSSYIQALKEVKPDIVITALWGGDFMAFLKQANAAALFDDMRVANFDTGANYDILVALGDTPPPGLILSARHHNNWPDTGYNKRFVTAFHALAGRYPTYAAEGAYTGIIAIARAVTAVGNATDTDALITEMEGLKLPLPEDPPGFVSQIDPETHQIEQAQAIGVPVPDTRFPPAKVMLGAIKVYGAEELRPPVDLVRRRRAAASGGSETPPNQHKENPQGDRQ
ncbi:ABC transporter substrate-binding protein [Rhodospirillum sp. A1_3_36]|uniref:ABC transporter substrate-binding protein n=1 Tax=Rhodospirillum sp. A1_3_36 TaxID=3391666 RepID=UPI0039A56534